MRYAILADIHSNLAALTAVLNDLEKRGGADDLWCLGDIVGYGPDPRPCLALMRRCDAVCIAGNHDWAAIGKLDTSFFNPAAATACHWTARQLSAEDIDFLAGLPLTLELDEFTLAHGSPLEPLLEYIISTGIADRNMAAFKTPYCLVGHSHVPAVFKQADESSLSFPFSPAVGLVLGEDRMIINPGSVGQPRDGDRRASYAVYDSEGGMFRLYRVEYDIRTTQDRIMKAGLPVQLASRLDHGR